MKSKIKVSGIYMWINKINGKYYLGSSKDIFGVRGGSYCGRKNDHLKDLNKNCHNNEHLQNAWNKYGEENFKFAIIERNVPESMLLIVEQEYLDIAKMEKEKVYNKSFIAHRTEMTQEIRDKIGLASKTRLMDKRNHPCFGKHLSEEWRKNIAIGNTGKILSKETRLKMSISRKGKILGPQPALAGKNNPKYDERIHILKNIKTKEIFTGTQYEFYTKFNFKQNCIWFIKSGRCNTIGKEWNLIFVDGIEFENKQPLEKDTKVYLFYNKRTKESFSGFRYDFAKQHNLQSSKVLGLIRGEVKSIKGWIIHNPELLSHKENAEPLRSNHLPGLNSENEQLL